MRSESEQKHEENGHGCASGQKKKKSIKSIVCATGNINSWGSAEKLAGLADGFDVLLVQETKALGEQEGKLKEAFKNMGFNSTFTETATATSRTGRSGGLAIGWKRTVPSECPRVVARGRAMTVHISSSALGKFNIVNLYGHASDEMGDLNGT